MKYTIKPKKSLGQHFLKDEQIAKKIVDSLSYKEYSKVLEIGSGMGVLTKYLAKKKEVDLYLSEVEYESIKYLQTHYAGLQERLITTDILKYDLGKIGKEPLAVIGNFPYNISSQILFKVYDNRANIKEVVGMFQKEVAERVVATPKNKVYGILSVLIQAFYEVEYLFTVPPQVFYPPPKVQSGVIRLVRNTTVALNCDEKLFFQVVKTAFNQRRKMLRNAIRCYTSHMDAEHYPILKQRAEELSVDEFVGLTNLIAQRGL